MPAYNFFESLGLAENGDIPAKMAIPLLIDYHDGAKPVSRAIYGLTPEKHLIIGGLVPNGAGLRIGSIDEEDVVETTSHALDKILAFKNTSGVLMFSCLARFVALGADTTAEVELISKRLGAHGIPFSLSYCGGELCPVYSIDGKTINKLHNDTFIACIL